MSGKYLYKTLGILFYAALLLLLTFMVAKGFYVDNAKDAAEISRRFLLVNNMEIILFLAISPLVFIYYLTISIGYYRRRNWPNWSSLLIQLLIIVLFLYYFVRSLLDYSE